MSMKTTIETKLTDAFAPSKLEVIDDSHHHAGHAAAGDNPHETHFTVVIASEALAEKSRVQQHQMIYGALDAELKGTLHALAIKVE